MVLDRVMRWVSFGVMVVATGLVLYRVYIAVGFSVPGMV